MNHDDQKLTAYALDELPPEDRAQIEALLREQPSAAAEVRETKEMAGLMRNLFHAELTEGLTPRRREAILAEAITCAAAQAEAPTPSNIITSGRIWWQHTGFWQAAAACAVFGFGVYAITSTLATKSNPGPAIAQNSGMKVGIGNLGAEPAPVPAMVPIESVPEENPSAQPSGASALANGTPTQPRVLPTPQSTNIASQLALPDKPSMPRQPTMISPSADPARSLLPSERASIGVRTKPLPRGENGRPGAMSYGSSNPGEKLVLPTDGGEVTLSGGEASRYYATHEFLAVRWQEASSIREGNTYADLARYFRRDGGSGSKETQRFVMIRCPYIKVDVEFAGEPGKALAWPVPPETKLRTVSRPYFEPEQAQ